MGAAGTLTLQRPRWRLEKNISSNSCIFCLYFSLRLSTPKGQNKFSENLKDKDKAIPSRDTGEFLSPVDSECCCPRGTLWSPWKETRPEVTSLVCKFRFLPPAQSLPCNRCPVTICQMCDE